MRKLPSIALEIDQQGRYLDRVLRVEKLNSLSWVEFRQMVKVMDRLMVNLTDFNAVHFGPSGSQHRKRTRAATQARRPKGHARKTVEEAKNMNRAPKRPDLPKRGNRAFCSQ
jgi:hypothetical protein